MQINNLWEQQIVTVGDVEIKIESFLGSFNNIEYYQARLIGETDEEKRGLLRIGNIHGELAKEQQLREVLGPQKFLAPLLGMAIKSCPGDEKEIADKEVAELKSSFQLEDISVTQNPENSVASGETADDSVEIFKETKERLTRGEQIEDLQTETDLSQGQDHEQEIKIEAEYSEPAIGLVTNYLEEETYPEQPLGVGLETELLLLLTTLPDEEKTLERWLKTSPSPTEALLVVGQICQLFCLLARHNWCVLAIAPQFIQMGTPLTIFDLTAIHPLDQPLEIGLQGTYFPSTY
jgi:hypothetical protein